jgi:aspartate kinase
VSARSHEGDEIVRLVVQKFGGTSVSNATRVMAAARKAIRAKQAGNRVVVVVSARGDTTDELIDLAREICEKPPAREMDMLLATGEQISIALMAMAIHTLGEAAISFTGAQVGIVTDRTHTKARIQSIDTRRMRQALEEDKIVIVAGFQGTDADGNITTLGRGGSDTTAVALAAVLKHDPGIVAWSNGQVDCEIYTDVDGVYTTDPRVVPEARKMEIVSYDEMLEMASLGASVMHSRSIEFAKKYNVPVQVRSSFSDVDGTWIVPEADWMRGVIVCGAALVREEARVAIDGVPDVPGISHRIFSALADRNIVVDMIAQSVGSDGRASIGFTVLGGELAAALEVLTPLADEMGARLEHDAQVSKVSIVGTGMRTHPGVAQRMFDALAGAGINLKMITTAEIKISVLVDRVDGLKALRAIHQAFGLDRPRVGAGLPSGSPTPDQPAWATLAQGNGKEMATLTQRLASMEDILVDEVILATDQGRITLTGMPDRPGICAAVFQAVATAGISVDMIVQNLAASRAELSFSVPQPDLDRALNAVRALAKTLGPSVKVQADSNIARLSVLGVGMRTHVGVARKMFGALAADGINIALINTSEVCVNIVVDKGAGDHALAALKKAFGVD